MLYKSTKNTNYHYLPQLVVSILLMLSLSCIHNNNVVPKGIIVPEKMGKILTDLHLADAVANQNFTVKDVSDSIAWKNKSFRNLILRKYQIDTAMFDRSFSYYIQRPAEMDSIYARMITDLSRLQTRLSLDDAKKNPVISVKNKIDLGKTNKSTLHTRSLESGTIQKQMPHILSIDSLRKLHQKTRLTNTK